MTVHRLEIETRRELPDALALDTARRFSTWLDLHPAKVRTRRVYLLDLGLTDDEAGQVLDALVDPVAEVGALGMLRDDEPAEGSGVALTVGFRPGVTDNVGHTVKIAAEDRLGRSLEGHAYSQVVYLIDGLEPGEVERASRSLLHNPLIERVRLEVRPRALDLEVPRAGSEHQPSVETVPLRGADAETLERISKQGLLALSLLEMRAIQQHFADRGRDPTDAELECLAQTWSEHCKHKIFASPIRYTDPEGRTELIERGLFRTYVRGATESIAETRRQSGLDSDAHPFLVSVFHDNAGVVRFTEADHLVYKVETHNSPSALDPYGGAMTGIVGVNRDSFGTGRGADLLTNVWGYCLGDPRHEEQLPAGLMHPRRIRDGVHRGVIDGGNHSGIPYSRGFELFDDRYAGKPLVFCGTVALMPVETAGRPTQEKLIAEGDRVVMVGGRIGKDGIHGATFSSVQLDESSPVQAVQIGDPITQKMMFDMLAEARQLGLFSGMTDNGAGGLSSSVGEMAEATGGARIDLARAPLKYPGLDPWEILVSEAQERMTLAVPPEHLDAFLELAARREVEATVFGEFTSHGRFEVHYGEEVVCDLPLDFLHGGVPLPELEAVWDPPRPELASAEAREELAEPDRLADVLLALLARPSIGTDEDRCRHYDHEVKGLSVIKPFIGRFGDVPATATVLRARHGRDEGVVLGEGVHPYFSDLDTRAMAHACVDEGVRRVLCAGARLDRLSALDNFCWPDPVVKEGNPDGRHKLAQLVRACQGLREACEAYGVPLISGKDSMKNDAYLDGVKISIPPTLLVSVMGQLEQVTRAVPAEPRAVADELWLLGVTRDELGGSELARAAGLHFDTVPRTDLDANRNRYRGFVDLRDRGLVRSALAVGRGGLGAALASVTMASGFGIEVDRLPAGVDLLAALFAESTGRILFTSRPHQRPQVEAALEGQPLTKLGRVVPARADGGFLEIRGEGLHINLAAVVLRRHFQEGLRGL